MISTSEKVKARPKSRFIDVPHPHYRDDDLLVLRYTLALRSTGDFGTDIHITYSADSHLRDTFFPPHRHLDEEIGKVACHVLEKELSVLDSSPNSIKP